MIRVIAGALLAVCVGTAHASPKRKVSIETEPAGALVYLETVENGPICDATPCTVELPVGEQALVIELKGHARSYESIVVPRRGRIKIPVYKLEPSLGTLVVDGPKGATITVDGTDRGKAPIRVDVSAEAHHVVVTLGGETLYDEYVETKANEETPVTTRVATGTGAGDGDGDPDDEDEDEDEDVDITKAVVPGRARPSYLRVSAVFDVGFRQFTYQGRQTGDTLREGTQSGQWIGGVLAEVWPGVIAGSSRLRGLSLLGRAQFGLHSQQVTGPNIMNLSTFWQSLEVSARHRWMLGALDVEAGLGYVRDRLQYAGFTADIANAPDADYQSIRIGARLSRAFGSVEPYLGVENRFVLAGGNLEARFDDGTSINGIRAALGIAASLGKVSARVEGTITRYSWEFVYMPSSAYRADSAIDSIEQVQLSLGYAY